MFFTMAGTVEKPFHTARVSGAVSSYLVVPDLPEETSSATLDRVPDLVTIAQRARTPRAYRYIQSVCV